jgi:hypothetical protein
MVEAGDERNLAVIDSKRLQVLVLLVELSEERNLAAIDSKRLQVLVLLVKLSEERNLAAIDSKRLPVLLCFLFCFCFVCFFNLFYVYVRQVTAHVKRVECVRVGPSTQVKRVSCSVSMGPTLEPTTVSVTGPVSLASDVINSALAMVTHSKQFFFFNFI